MQPDAAYLFSSYNRPPVVPDKRNVAEELAPELALQERGFCRTSERVITSSFQVSQKHGCWLGKHEQGSRERVVKETVLKNSDDARAKHRATGVHETKSVIRECSYKRCQLTSSPTTCNHNCKQLPKLFKLHSPAYRT